MPLTTRPGRRERGGLAAPAADGPPRNCFQLAASVGGVAFPPQSGTRQRAREVCLVGHDWLIADGSRGSRASDAVGLPASSGLGEQVAAEREETAG